LMVSADTLESFRLHGCQLSFRSWGHLNLLTCCN
jgi:hypothetical protein